MSFDSFWNALMTQKPVNDDQSVRLTKQQFHGILKQAYDAGEKSKNETDKRYDFFRDFFGLKENK